MCMCVFPDFTADEIVSMLATFQVSTVVIQAAITTLSQVNTLSTSMKLMLYTV